MSEKFSTYQAEMLQITRNGDNYALVQSGDWLAEEQLYVKGSGAPLSLDMS